MKRHPVQQLQSELDQILALLDQQALFSLTPEATVDLRKSVNDLVHKLAAIEGSFLTIGLLGGTGVGKSTLMNALAGSKIASASHRRPHTEHILVYRHAHANPLPRLQDESIPWREITHQAAPLQQVLLCDLPDFDSLLGDHRKRVLQFMDHLDVLLWVTSPEKYADGRFYEFLKVVPKAKQNFFFVLNKADLLFQGETGEAGYEQMARVAASFQEHVKESGIGEPLLFLISAEEVLHTEELSPWNQFRSLSQQVFQQRDIKQIMAIKAANLDVEAQQLHAVLVKERRILEGIEKTLTDSIKDIKQQRSLQLQAGQDAIDLWLNKYVRPEILSGKSDPTCLVGPGYALATLFQRFGQKRAMEPDLSSSAPPKEIVLLFQRQLEWLDNRLRHRMLRQNLPPLFQERFQAILDISQTLEGLTERFSQVVARCIARPPLPAFWGFKALQFLTYLLLLMLLLLAIGGESAWKALLDNPGGICLLHLILAGTQTLFSAKGLAALLSFGLLNLFFALRFYGRYKKLLRGAAEKIIESLKAGLIGVWEETLSSIPDDLNRTGEDVRSRILAISAGKTDKGMP